METDILLDQLAAWPPEVPPPAFAFVEAVWHLAGHDPIMSPVQVSRAWVGGELSFALICPRCLAAWLRVEIPRSAGDRPGDYDLRTRYCFEHGNGSLTELGDSSGRRLPIPAHFLIREFAIALAMDDRYRYARNSHHRQVNLLDKFDHSFLRYI